MKLALLRIEKSAITGETRYTAVLSATLYEPDQTVSSHFGTFKAKLTEEEALSNTFSVIEELAINKINALLR